MQAARPRPSQPPGPPHPASGPAPVSSLAVDGALWVVVLMWAATFTLFKVAWRQIDPVAFTGIRFAAMVLFAFGLLFLARDRVPLRRADVPRIAASGILGYFCYQLGFVLGLDRTTAVASAILISTHPLFSVIFVWLSGREQPNRVAVAGVVLGFVGVAVFLRVWDAVAAARPGDLLSLGAAAAFGAYGVVNQPLSARYSSRTVMGYGLGIGGTLVALVSLPAMIHQDWSAVGGTSWLILVFAAVGPVYVAYALWNWAIHRRGVARTVVYGFLVPVVAWLLALIALHERVRPEQVAGALLVVAGLVVSRLGSARQARRTRALTAGSVIEP
jgi:drug/metabolite transporter (DMT)-like permease